MADQTLAFRADPALAAAVLSEAGRRGVTSSELLREHVSTGLARVTEPATYAFDGRPGPSLVRDAWSALTHGAGAADAEHRLGRFRRQLDDNPSFALGTGQLGEVVAPRYEPLVPEQATDRPLRSLCTMLPLPSPTPFTLPGVVTATGATAPHVEGTNPTDGTLTVAGETVSPAGVSGRFEITRELADASNPAIDAVALAAMVEDYNRRVEAMVVAELDLLTPAATTAAATIAVDINNHIARMVGTRRRRAVAAAASAADAIADALSEGLDPTTGGPDAQWRSQGVRVDLSADLPGAVAGDLAAVIVAPSSLWGWESGPKTFRWEQKSGPAVIEVALWGYFATRVLHPDGVRTLALA